MNKSLHQHSRAVHQPMTSKRKECTHTSSHISCGREPQAGGLRPLLDLLESRNGNLQHNAAFALYGLADNEDNIADIVRDGAASSPGLMRIMQWAIVSLHA